ncbi:hypothetical protein CXB51_006009 [Gossypium anomalum]|uniref:Uncharacterized protein n=1 Tax=Gossypium anomalum TaxID=47600 RepID=A0A8J5ZMZ4_9ROSI|nr:hypothetical protein CXB51_006009 [Gossypium anomalum]
MASLQYSSASWVAQYTEFRPLTIVQPGNNGRHSINLVTKHTNSILKFSQISYDIKYNSKGNEWRSIMNFLQNLMEAMGQNVHFVIDNWMEGDNLTASSGKAKRYHIRQVAISLNVNRLMESLLSGSISTIHVISTLHYQFKKIDDWLIRSKITGVEEFPVKPGDWVLKLLKATIVVFDKFRFPAERM